MEVALAQVKPKLGCVRDNLTMVEACIAKAVEAKAACIVFPELALTGYFLKDLVPEVAITLDSNEMSQLKKASHHISIAIGFVEVTPDYLFYNCAAYLEAGEVKHVHRKVYLPTYGLFDEQRYMARGGHIAAFDTRLGRIGMLLCEDMWHLSSSYILAMDGASTLLCLSSSPGRGLSCDERLDSTLAWQKLTSTTAMFLHCHVLFCNRVGYEDGVNFWGGSEVLAPSGAVLKRGKMFEEDLVLASIEEGALRRERISSPILRDESLSITMKELSRIEKKRDC